MSRQLRWGVLGTGNIARQFCGSMHTSHRGTLEAVASRSAEHAAAFAKRFEIPRSFGSYAELLKCAEVDAVYVSLPNSLHHEWAIAALRQGKHVLCEKPFASNTRQANEMFDAAEAASRIVVDGFMYRSHPLTHAVLQAIHDGAIGELKLIRSSFCYRTTRTSDNIRFSPELAGGGLMDVGCYCIDLSRLLARDEPISVSVTGTVNSAGVDEVAIGMMQFPRGAFASFTCGMTVQADNTAYICGTEGYIEIPVPWKPPTNGAVWHLAHSMAPRMDSENSQSPASYRARQTFSVNAPVDLYALEADDFAAAVLDRKPPRISRHDTIGNMKVLDQMRASLGVKTYQ